MGIMDFLFGTPDQTGQLDPQTKAARDFLLNQMLMQYSAGPVNVPQYQAVAPSAMYSGTNALLGSLGLEGVSAPSMPTTQVGGMDVYTSAPFQQSMETAYAEQYPGQYDYLRSFYMDPVTGEMGERSYGYADPMNTAAEAAPVGSSGSGTNLAREMALAKQRDRPVQFSGPEGIPSTRPRPRPAGGIANTGYTSIKDMFDGGGAGQSGDTYSSGKKRGGLSKLLWG
jgi:hypothetical protein